MLLIFKMFVMMSHNILTFCIGEIWIRGENKGGWKITGQNHCDEPNCRPISSVLSEGFILKANTA